MSADGRMPIFTREGALYMLWNAKNGCVPVGGADMYYVSFGHGETPLVLLPGLSDGLATVKGKALLLAAPYRLFFEKYIVYMFSRRNELPDGFSIRDMAADQAAAMRALGLTDAGVVGVSQGGMIAQYLAIDCPELVRKLVIAVSAPRCGDMAREFVGRQIGFAERGDHKGLMIDAAERSYSERYLKKYRRLYPVIGRIGKPKDYQRFLANARAILAFDAADELARIACPTLILGGDDDRIVGAGASRELHERIAFSELHVYPGLGHAAYEEAPDFNERILRFMEKEI